MSSPYDQAGFSPTDAVIADPKRPYKTYVAIAIAILITVVQAVQAALLDGVWNGEDTTVTFLAFLNAVGVYYVENPKVLR